MDKDHNIALGYSKSSLSVKPSIFITGRLSTDPINTLGAEAQVEAGIGVQQAGAEPLGRLQRYDPRPGRPVYLLLHK